MTKITLTARNWENEKQNKIPGMPLPSDTWIEAAGLSISNYA